MDGNFVPNLTFGPKLVKDIRPITKLPLDVHMMVLHPESYIDELSEAGADMVTFHIEAGVHSDRTIQAIHRAGMRPGISIVPSSPVVLLEEVLEKVSLVLVMTVNPGFGGQGLVESCLKKITQLAEFRTRNSLDYSISIDGGASIDNRNLFWNAGADIIVSGSSFFKSKDKGEFVKTMKT